MIDITEYWPVAAAVAAVLTAISCTRYLYLQVGRLRGRAEVHQEQRHAKAVRL